jgi:hypothetical protein
MEGMLGQMFDGGGKYLQGLTNEMGPVFSCLRYAATR